MRAYYAINPLGVFAYDERGHLLAHALFPKDPVQVVERLAAASKGQLVPEDTALVQQLKGKADSIMWDKKVCVPGLQCVEGQSPAAAWLARDFRSVALAEGWTPAELSRVLSQVQVLRTRAQVSAQSRDVILMQAANALESAERALNTLTEHVREWYGLHATVASLGNEQLLATAAAGTGGSGMAFTDADRSAAQEFAKAVQALGAERDKLKSYIETLAPAVAPNCSAIAGPVLAAKLLSLAGGLERLARLPASTIQVLGAEKALFRHLKGEGKAPKYGALFAHPAVQAAHEKGKAARLIAAKLALAARVDFYRKSLDPGLKADLDRKLAALQAL